MQMNMRLSQVMKTRKKNRRRIIKSVKIKQRKNSRSEGKDKMNKNRRKRK